MCLILSLPHLTANISVLKLKTFFLHSWGKHWYGCPFKKLRILFRGIKPYFRWGRGECPQKGFTKSVHQKCSHKICPQKWYKKSVHKKYPQKLSKNRVNKSIHKRVNTKFKKQMCSQKCPSKLCPQKVCLPKVFTKKGLKKLIV